MTSLAICSWMRTKLFQNTFGVFFKPEAKKRCFQKKKIPTYLYICVCVLARSTTRSYILKLGALITCIHMDTLVDAEGINIHQCNAIYLKMLAPIPVCDTGKHTHTLPRTHTGTNTRLHLPLTGPLTMLRRRKVGGSGVSFIPAINHTLAR